MPTTRHTFSKAEKLKSRKSIEALFAGGKSFSAFPIKVVYTLGVNAVPSADAALSGKAGQEFSVNTSESAPVEPDIVLTPIKVGVSASKRSFKKATDRNRVKRLLREAYRLHKHTLTAKAGQRAMQLEVFFIFLDKTLPSFALVEEKMRYCLRRLGKIVEGGS